MLDAYDRVSVEVTVRLANAIAVAEELELTTRGRTFEVRSGAARVLLKTIDDDARIKANEWAKELVVKGGILGRLESQWLADLQRAHDRISGLRRPGPEREALSRLFPDALERELTSSDIRELRARVAERTMRLRSARDSGAHDVSHQTGNVSDLSINDTRDIVHAVDEVLKDLICVMFREHRVDLEMGLSLEATQVVRPIVNSILFGADCSPRLGKVRRRDALERMHSAFERGEVKPHFNSLATWFLPR